MTETPRPTAESPTLNKAARALLDLFGRAEIHPADLERRLLEVQSEAAALSDSARPILVRVLDEFDRWVSEPRPAVDGGLVRIHNFLEVQPSMERVLAEARALLAQPTQPPYLGQEVDLVGGVTVTNNAQPTPDAPSLDAAWKAAEDALPERWKIERVWRNGDWEARAVFGRGSSMQLRFAHGPTPTAALQALATALTKP